MSWVFISSCRIQQRESKTNCRATHGFLWEWGKKSNKRHAHLLSKFTKTAPQSTNSIQSTLHWEWVDFMIPLALQTEQQAVWSLQIDRIIAKLSPTDRRHQKWCQTLSCCSFHHVKHTQMTHRPPGTPISWKYTHLFLVCPTLCHVHSYGFITKYKEGERQQWCFPYSSCMSNSQVWGI